MHRAPSWTEPAPLCWAGTPPDPAVLCAGSPPAASRRCSLAPMVHAHTHACKPRGHDVHADAPPAQTMPTSSGRAGRTARTRAPPTACLHTLACASRSPWCAQPARPCRWCCAGPLGALQALTLSNAAQLLAVIMVRCGLSWCCDPAQASAHPQTRLAQAVTGCSGLPAPDVQPAQGQSSLCRASSTRLRWWAALWQARRLPFAALSWPAELQTAPRLLVRAAAERQERPEGGVRVHAATQGPSSSRQPTRTRTSRNVRQPAPVQLHTRRCWSAGPKPGMQSETALCADLVGVCLLASGADSPAWPAILPARACTDLPGQAMSAEQSAAVRVRCCSLVSKPTPQRQLCAQARPGLPAVALQRVCTMHPCVQGWARSCT